MGKDRDNRPDTDDDYQFMKETIKKRPPDTRRIFCKAAAIVGGGALFGVSAAAAFFLSAPRIQELSIRTGKKEDVKLAAPTPGEAAETEEGEDETSDFREAAVSSAADTVTGVPMEEYEKIYSQALEISREPRKALVNVSGVSDSADLLDDSLLSYGDMEGIIFLESGPDFYILTESEEIEDAEKLQITFADSSTAEGFLCKTDSRTGLAVVRVPSMEISEETRQEISVANLSDSYSLQQAKPVIAIGSPTGDKDGVLYGVVTAVSSKLAVADAEFNLMTTDMQGSPEGSGVLLDAFGDVVGIITKKGEGETNIIRALSVTQLRSLIETMSNGEAIRYLGIHGVSITQAQAKGLGIPQGVYVNRVDNASPAMTAGIQSGDIITGMAGKSVKSMQSYTTILQKQKTGDKVKVAVSRQNGEEGYGEMEFEVSVEEK